MAIDEDDGLRKLAAGARAQSITRQRIAPPMPVDVSSSPFAKPSGPELHSVGREMRERASAAMEVPTPPKRKTKTQEPESTQLTHEKQRLKATTLVTHLLENWYKDAKDNVPKANKNLAFQLMLNGSALIECAYPLDTLNSLINLNARLLVSSQDDDGLNDNAEALHNWMSRTDEPKGEEPEEDENGDD